jgi:hypothetical protein
MRKTIMALSLAAGTCVFSAHALTVADFDYIESTGELARLCGVDKTEPMADEAHIFCLGYIAAAISYHDEVAKSPEMGPIACSEEETTREDVLRMFLAWSASNPRYADAPPIEGLLRAAADKWPCE